MVKRPSRLTAPASAPAKRNNRRQSKRRTDRKSENAITEAVRSVGIDPATIEADHLELAAEIHARYGVPPDEAFAIAVTNSLIHEGYLERAQCEAAEQLFAYQGSLTAPRSSEGAVMFCRSEYYSNSTENADRYDATFSILQAQGGFTINEAMMAFWPTTPATQKVKERVAAWLRSELNKLRKAERCGEHPVRRQKALSRLTISDIAITLLESGERCAPGKNLVCLLQELLDVDRHRATLAQSAMYSDDFIDAATLDGEGESEGKTYSARQLARLVGVSPGTIIAWRELPRYRFYVDLASGSLDA
jgi:hypothetical protein